jgi:hypothetical protein
VHGIARNEHQVPGRNSFGFLSHAKTARAFQDQHDFVVVWLQVKDIFAVFENVHVAREVLSVKQKCALDRVCSRRWIGAETTESIF